MEAPPDGARAPDGEAKWMTLTWFLRPDRYEGEVVDGHMHGKGTYWHADSSRYEGSFARSQRHGYGEYFFADGSYYKGEYKGWRSATQHQAHRGRGHSPPASAAAAAAEPEWEDDPLPTHRSADSALETPGSTDSRARARKPRRAKQPHNALPTIQPPRGPYKVRDSLSIIATDELPPGPFVDKLEIEMYRHVTQR